MIWQVSVRVRNPNVWEVKAKALGLLEDKVITDDEGVETTIVAPIDGLIVHKLPPLVETPGTYDEDGNELTPPVFYAQEHYDLLTNTPTVADLLQTIIADAVNGNTQAQANKNEVSYKHGGIEFLVDLVDGSYVNTVNSRSHVFL
jgi:hypothetical protein